MNTSQYLISAYNAGHNDKDILSNLFTMTESKMGFDVAVDTSKRYEKVLAWLRKNYKQIDIKTIQKAVIANYPEMVPGNCRK